ncbi:MAG: hypothetical protein IPM34_01495 [Saprospiraceae bacterium]|nr:hypothetical protein [Saprospiraceae bacterium]
MSKSGQEHWLDRLFRKRLDSFEMNPSDAVWENIARHLDGEKRRPFLLGNWVNWLWAVIFLAVVGGLVALLWLNRNPDQMIQPKHPLDLPDQNQGAEDKGTAMLSLQSQTSNSISEASEAIATQVSYIVEKKAPEIGDKNLLSSNSSASYGYERNSETTQSKKDLSARSDQDEIAEENESVANDLNYTAGDHLIASADPNFIIEKTEETRWSETSKIPGIQNFLQAKDRKLDFTKIAEGCNVYNNDKTHFFVDAYYAPELAKRSFSVSDPSMLSYAEKRANTEKPILSYTMGLRGSVVFSNGLAFRTGLQYSNNSERFDYNYIKETQTIIKDKNGNVISLDTQITEIMDQSYNHFRSFDIPFILGYERDLKDFILSVNGGLGFNISTRHSGKIYQADQKTIYNLGDPGEGSQLIYKTKAGLSLITSIGLNYKYNERMMLMLEPSARYYFNSITEDSYPVKQKYLFFGLNIGLRYRVL